MSSRKRWQDLKQQQQHELQQRLAYALCHTRSWSWNVSLCCRDNCYNIQNFHLVCLCSDNMKANTPTATTQADKPSILCYIRYMFICMCVCNLLDLSVCVFVCHLKCRHVLLTQLVALLLLPLPLKSLQHC